MRKWRLHIDPAHHSKNTGHIHLCFLVSRLASSPGSRFIEFESSNQKSPRIQIQQHSDKSPASLFYCGPRPIGCNFNNKLSIQNAKQQVLPTTEKNHSFLSPLDLNNSTRRCTIQNPASIVYRNIDVKDSIKPRHAHDHAMTRVTPNWSLDPAAALALTVIGGNSDADAISSFMYDEQASSRRESTLSMTSDFPQTRAKLKPKKIAFEAKGSDYPPSSQNALPHASGISHCYGPSFTSYLTQVTNSTPIAITPIHPSQPPEYSQIFRHEVVLAQFRHEGRVERFDDVWGEEEAREDHFEFTLAFHFHFRGVDF
ncbi:hypothetical protein M422DRAFT_249119 [Sphaerobolus stellatus SS14]|nr:hypothetical protein M422DRAFT_249119 [Sphaerobolus stellatus SS14]